MDLASMLEREDFFGSFFSTVKKYYKEALGQDITLSFDEKSCNMVIQPRLSAATAVHMSKEARKFFYSEWNIRGSLWKNLLAKTYVAVMTRTGKAFAQYRFRMEPASALSPHFVIAPNNRSIRFFDYGSGTVGCIIKDGFTRRFFDAQLNFRKTYHYDFMVPLLNSGEDWFIEPILYGHPLARTTDEAAYQKGIADAMAAVRQLAEDTVEYDNGYAKELLAKVRVLTKRAVEEKHITTGAETEALLQEIEGRLSALGTSVPTSISHGDLQSGNIWVDEQGKTLVYDWETVDRRSVWYDSAVLQYSLRRHEGWPALAREKHPELLLCNDPQKDHTEAQLDAIKALVLLEDICFYSEDMLELPETWGAELYDAFIGRVTGKGE